MTFFENIIEWSIKNENTLFISLHVILLLLLVDVRHMEVFATVREEAFNVITSLYVRCTPLKHIKKIVN